MNFQNIVFLKTKGGKMMKLVKIKEIKVKKPVASQSKSSYTGN